MNRFPKVGDVISYTDILTGKRTKYLVFKETDASHDIEPRLWLLLWSLSPGCPPVCHYLFTAGHLRFFELDAEIK